MEIKLVVLRLVMLFADLFGLPQNTVVPCGLLPFPPKAVIQKREGEKTCPACSPIGVWAGRYPTDEQLGHVHIFFSNYCNLQSVYFEYINTDPLQFVFYKNRMKTDSFVD